MAPKSIVQCKKFFCPCFFLHQLETRDEDIKYLCHTKRNFKIQKFYKMKRLLLKQEVTIIHNNTERLLSFLMNEMVNYKALSHDFFLFFWLIFKILDYKKINANSCCYGQSGFESKNVFYSFFYSSVVNWYLNKTFFDLITTSSKALIQLSWKVILILDKRFQNQTVQISIFNLLILTFIATIIWDYSV